MIAVLFRIAFAVLVAIFLSKFFFRENRNLGGGNSCKPRGKEKDDCIEICPECGHLREKNHRCP